MIAGIEERGGSIGISGEIQVAIAAGLARFNRMGAALSLDLRRICVPSAIAINSLSPIRSNRAGVAIALLTSANCNRSSRPFAQD